MVLSDTRVHKFAEILVEHSVRVKPGDRILIEATTAAEPLVRELYVQILAKGGQPVPLLQLSDMFFPGHEDLLTLSGSDAQLDFVPPMHKLAYDQFEGRIRIHSTTNTRSQGSMNAARAQRRGKATGVITEIQMRRGAAQEFKWCTTLYPTDAYAQDAGMSLPQYEDFVFGAVHAQEADPIQYWRGTAAGQQKAIDWLKGKDQIVVRGPNADLTLSIRGRTFMNSTGVYNMPVRLVRPFGE
jgi:aminopeptidase